MTWNRITVVNDPAPPCERGPPAFIGRTADALRKILNEIAASTMDTVAINNCYKQNPRDRR